MSANFKVPFITSLRCFASSLQNSTSRARLTSLSVSIGLALIGILAVYYKRKRGRKPKKPSTAQRQISSDIFANHRHGNGMGLIANGDVYRTPSPLTRRLDSISSASKSLTRDRSLHSSTLSLGMASSTDTITFPDTTNMSSGQLCNLGFETLQIAIHYWEDARLKLQSSEESIEVIQDSETTELLMQLNNLLQSAYRMIDTYERHADHVVFDSALMAFTEVDRLSSRRSLSFEDSSDQESFVSATDMANLSDLDNHKEMFHHLPLYEAGLLELKHGTIPCRTLRTEMTQCLSDTEYLAKLHCVRLSLDVIFRTQSNRDYFTSVGQQLLGNFLIKTQREPEDFYTAYADMLEFIAEDSNWGKIEEELKARGVKCMTFFDIVLDFIMMDAFDDLANPPSSVITVVQNRWLTNGFKETALATACWSVLKAKKRLLKFPDGFISKFYDISEHTTPILAWGFMGPESELKNMCIYFKDLILGFIQDMFSFDKCRFTTVDDLAEDILILAKLRAEDAARELGS